MALLVLPHPTFPAGTTAVGSQVAANDTTIQTFVNGQLGDDNIANASITGSSKLIDGTVNPAKIASRAVTNAKLELDEASAGVKVWQLGPSYPGSGGGRIIRVEKTIVLAAVTSVQSFTVSWDAADAVDGATTFEADPTVVGISLLDEGSAIDVSCVMAQQFLSAISTTGCTVKLRFSTAPTGGNVTLSLIVAGGIAA